MTKEDIIAYTKGLSIADKHKAIGDIFVDSLEDGDLGRFRDLIASLKSTEKSPWNSGLFREVCSDYIDWYDWNQFWTDKEVFYLVDLPSTVYEGDECEEGVSLLFNVLDALSSPQMITKKLGDFL
jgi:hypothetical protein